MLKSTVIAAGLAALMFNSAPGSSEAGSAAALDLEPAINGAVSASGLFPSQEMEQAFQAYLTWTKRQGLSRLAAFEEGGRGLEPAVNARVSAKGGFPEQEMEDAFQAYLAWTEKTDAGPFYAFRVTDFD